MSVLTDIAKIKTLTDYCDTRVAVLEKIKNAFDLLSDAEKDMDEIGNHIFPYEAKSRLNLDDCKRYLDQRLWRHAFDMTGFLQLMDREAKQEFMRGVEENPPEFTVPNVRSTFLSAAQDADKMFARGLVNVFLRLSDKHKTNTNEPFKINRRAILPYVVQIRYSGGLEVRSYGGWSYEQLNDVDRVFKTLDGKKHNPRELECKINEVFKSCNLYEDEYYRMRGFKNGNMHIEFKRADLLEKANKIIHEFYNGSALAGKKRI